MGTVSSGVKTCSASRKTSCVSLRRRLHYYASLSLFFLVFSFCIELSESLGSSGQTLGVESLFFNDL